MLRMKLITRRAILVTVTAPFIRRSAKAQAHEFQWVNERVNVPDDTRLPKLSDFAGLQHRKFKSGRNNTEIGYYIYLPPQYETSPGSRYPVVYTLHGAPTGSERGGAGAVRWLDPAIRAGRVPPMIYVFPNGGKLPFHDLPGSFAETALVKELIPHIDQNYRTIARRESRGLEGMSFGGRATARLLFKYPELFSSGVAISAGYQHEKNISLHYGEDVQVNVLTNTGDGLQMRRFQHVFEAGDNTYDAARLYAKNRRDHTRILVVVGTKDANYDGTLDWMRHLDSLDIKYEKIIIPDVGHDYLAIYDTVGDQVFKFNSNNLLR